MSTHCVDNVNNVQQITQKRKLTIWCPLLYLYPYPEFSCLKGHFFIRVVDEFSQFWRHLRLTKCKIRNSTEGNFSLPDKIKNVPAGEPPPEKKSSLYKTLWPKIKCQVRWDSAIQGDIYFGKTAYKNKDSGDNKVCDRSRPMGPKCNLSAKLSLESCNCKCAKGRNNLTIWEASKAKIYTQKSESLLKKCAHNPLSCSSKWRQAAWEFLCVLFLKYNPEPRFVAQVTFSTSSETSLPVCYFFMNFGFVENEEWKCIVKYAVFS